MGAIYRKNAIKIKLFLSALCLNLPLLGGGVVATNSALQKSIDDSQAIVEHWIGLVDQGQYGQSWDEASQKLQITMPRGEWIRVIESWRKPLGKVAGRNLADIRVAENPPGLPAGQYLVYVYQTAFQNKGEVIEVITITQNTQQEWKILTYNLK